MKYADRVALVASTAARSGGVITRHEIRRLGLSDRAIATMVRAGSLRRVHRGVYVLAGTPPTHTTAARAAVAAVGPGALASHGSAGWLAGLIDRPPGQVHLTKPGECSWRAPGVVIHQVGEPLPGRHFQGVACTAVPRTLVDLATCLSAPELALAVDRALARARVRLVDIEKELAGPPRRGVGILRACLQERGDVCMPEASVLEARMARLLSRGGMPRPRADVRAGPGGRYRIDYAYPERLLAVELHGYAWHHSPEQMRADLARQNSLVLAGWVVLVYSWRDVIYDGPRVLAEITRAHATCRPRPLRVER